MANRNPSPLTRFQSGSQAEKAGRKGGQASGESKRALKAMAEIDQETTTDEERLQMLRKLKELAMKGNLRAFVIYRDTVGLKPANNVKIEKVSQAAIDEVEAFLYGTDGSSGYDPEDDMEVKKVLMDYYTMKQQ